MKFTNILRILVSPAKCRSRLWLGVVAPITATLLAVQNLPAQPLFTGISAFSSDSSGGASGPPVVWNTRGGDTIVNLFLIGGTDPNGAFLNGPADAQAGISIPLNPGTYTFTMMAGQPEMEPYFGINLFFDGNNTTARISAFGPVQSSAGPPFPGFSVNGSASTYSLIGTTIPGANSLSYVDGNTQITLTSYGWVTPSVYSLDRIYAPTGNPGQLGSDGILDSVGQITLEVTLVPEPSSLALFGFGIAGIVARARRGNSKARCH